MLYKTKMALLFVWISNIKCNNKKITNLDQGQTGISYSEWFKQTEELRNSDTHTKLQR